MAHHKQMELGKGMVKKTSQSLLIQQEMIGQEELPQW